MSGANDKTGAFADDALSDFQRRLIVADRTDEQDGGVVITPDPTGIVIKTLLVKETHCHLLLDDCVDDSYLPRTLTSIYAGNQNNVADTPDANDTKVFLNICTHPLIAVPGKRKGLDEGTGKEVDGWRLPMSVGEIRPCYDKMGKTAVAADCVLNPSVVREMNADSNYFHCVCDFIVECASRKFGRTWFGGHDLDRRFKLPKMKYAGYVDETTGLPAIPRDVQPIHGSVAKQRVKGHGGKSSIIEELDCSPSKHTDFRNNFSLVSTIASGVEVAPARGIDRYRIELYISYDQILIPMLKFLRLVSEADIVPLRQPFHTLSEIIKSPELKSCDEEDNLHESQRLIAPLPIDASLFVHAAGVFRSNAAKTCGESTGNRLDHFSIIAKCSIGTNSSMSSIPTTQPMVELSAFTLLVSGVECILPFPVDAHQTIVANNPHTGEMQIRMPLLQYSGPDPGTRQWELQKAFCSGNMSATVDGTVGSSDRVLDCKNYESSRLGSTVGDVMFSAYFQDVCDDDAEEDANDSQQLPEDVFHSQDILSRHILQKQEEERRARRSTESRDGAEVEYINVNELCSKQGSVRDYCVAPTLKMAENVLKNQLSDHCKGFIMGLV